jgi:RNA polymerase sigma-70 factor, ECF subfamily
LADRDEARKFEESLLGWLDDVYNLARWLLRDDQDAQDAVQDAFMRAARYAGGFRGGDRRAWLLAIVRNVCYTQLSRSRTAATNVVFDEEQHQGTDLVLTASWDSSRRSKSSAISRSAPIARASARRSRR